MPMASGRRTTGNGSLWIAACCSGREGHTPGVDLIMPDIRFLAEQRENVLGIVATHAHEDHIGAIAPLWPSLRCPVYATPFTARLIAGKLEEAGLSGKVRRSEEHTSELQSRFDLV